MKLFVEYYSTKIILLLSFKYNLLHYVTSITRDVFTVAFSMFDCVTEITYKGYNKGK